MANENTNDINTGMNPNPQGNPTGGGGRGFAGMDRDKQREIASKGGKAAHESGNAHEFDSEEAREAGRKGGLSRGTRQNGLNDEDNLM